MSTAGVRMSTVGLLLVCLALSGTAADNARQVILSGEPGAVVELGTTVIVSGTTNAKLIAQTVLMLNRQPVDAKQGSGDYLLKWQTGNAGIGSHDLEVAVLSANGTRRIVSRAQITVVQGPAVAIFLPGGVAGFAHPCRIAVKPAAGYAPTKARLWVDSTQAKSELSIVDGEIEWDAGAAASGDHSLRIVTRDYDGRVAYSPSITVKVPHRLTVKVPDTVVITQDSPDIVLDITIPEGIEVTKLKAWVDVDPAVEVDSRTSALKLPAIGLESGKHEVRAEMVTGTGAVYKQGPFSVVVDNQHAASLVAAAAAERAVAEAAEKAQNEAMERGAEEERKRVAQLRGQSGAKEQNAAVPARSRESAFLEAARLSSTAGAASRPQLAKSGVAPSRARGMSVISVDGALEFGGTFTVTAKLSRGEGAVTVNGAEADAEMADSVRNAREFAIAYLKKHGRNVDLSKANIDLQYDRNGPKVGDSAGAAMAVAIISALTRTPVRNEVVVTGAVRDGGAIMPVSSLDLKAASALQDPTVLTIVVPRFRQSAEDVLNLPPDVLAGHRIVPAEDMNVVVRQALAGSDDGSVSKASGFFAQGLAQYAAGKIPSAISYLERAAELTPEDLTIPVWISAVKKAER